MTFGHHPKQGLYDPSFEHDACGVAFVATMTGVASHRIIEQALEVLRNLDHRGATGADPAAGDGAGILVQIPDAFLRRVTGLRLPEPGSYAVGMAYMPSDEAKRARSRAVIELIAADEGIQVLGWREVPVHTETLSPISLSTMPHFEQVLISARDGRVGMDLERLAFVLRRRAQHEAGVYFASLSARTLVYKGMLTTNQLEEVFPELGDEDFTSALALVHSRFSTNTFPTWELAHPFRMIAHNGEINTVAGNRNWMRAREALLKSDLIPGELSRLYPICTPGGSDSASFDEVLELLHLAGRSLPHAVLMMIPEAWQKSVHMDRKLRDFYAFHSFLMEPWDGPACVTFTDGNQIGAVLDRNGLRPARYWVSDDGLVVFASESGVLDIPAEHIVQKGRLQPGRMFLVDLSDHRIVDDAEIKETLADGAPYGEWLKGTMNLDEIPDRPHIVHSHSSVTRRQQLFGYTNEDERVLIAPMANNGAEALGSMGNDTPLAVLSNKPRMLWDYFTQLFAQVTNPPLDSIREELVTSLTGSIGPESNLLAPGPDSCRQLVINYPILDSDQLAKIVHINADGTHPGHQTHVVRGLFQIDLGGEGLAARLEEIRAEVSEAIEEGARIIVLSDRHATRELAPIPSLLLTSAVHHHLVRQKTRTQVGLVVEAGDVREVHHVALLIGYGASAVNPYLCFETAEDMARHETFVKVNPDAAIHNVYKALGKGVLKVMSKMGVSTISSYTGAQIFEATGLSQAFIDEYFTGTTSQIQGIGLTEIAAEIALRHRRAYPETGVRLPHRTLPVGGQYQWRREGEEHLLNPETVFRLQQATRTADYDQFKRYTDLVDENSSHLMTLRSLLEFNHDRPSIPIDEVEPETEIVKRFATGAMSYGSISMEAHQTLAIAMNRIGGKSNTGEGGEDPERLHDPSRRSAIKQVASGRFGVTSDYLVNADDLQIKMAQGAKPGEGGQLPGPKVYPWIARTRHATTGVGLISPPPHHDIYSIEDIKQLIHDLKCANPRARVHVKLVAEAGVGTVAAGVSKAKADVVLISGHDGGTGAAPLTSIKHAGGPWELGLAETQQTLLINGLRDRIVVQCDGQLKTGRDVMIAMLLGAEEYGCATTALVVEGCIMMRKCHSDTCPVGIATQNPELRKKFAGDPDHVVTFFMFMARQVREYLAELGFHSVEEAVGHVEVLRARSGVTHWKARGLDLSPVLAQVEVPFGQTLHHRIDQDHEIDESLDVSLIELAAPALERGEPVTERLPIRNVDRTVGTMLGNRVTLATDGKGLPDGTINLTFDGTAGQSFGAFLPAGITLKLIGDANDYVAKGLSGGRIIVTPPEGVVFRPEEQIIAGNVIGYGATSGEIFLRGVVGERFCVRNSGATAVVEGVGDHGCEYMTGGEALVLGPTGRNFAAGMSGGTAWVLHLDPTRLNPEMVDGLPLEAADLVRVRELLAAHHEATGSTVAADLLAADDETLAAAFTKVVPRDYARLLKVANQARDLKLDEEATTELLMEASNG
ncbi:glutamate synthase large subunit [Acidipropionibacterium jensenii]|uniref:glutamate synthase large subunit n=1 Tax=Acidipropionibacterium jensenii TaxID=1749 RepID=UPI00214B621A|nr:glutamate synthase large subunit [Acidipropionibacterium jensenii]